MYKRKFMNFEVKDLTEAGSFKGYGSVYDVLDLKGDVMKPGVFAKSLTDWKAKGKLPPILWQHKYDQPVGPYTKMNEDGKGLYTEGQLLINKVQQASEAYALLASGAINGQSVGYNTEDEEYDAKAGVWNVKQADLWECSIATFPANTFAVIDEVKNLIASGTMPTVRQFEKLLRDVGISKAHAVEVASKGWAPIYARRESEQEAASKSGESPDAKLDSIVDLISTKHFDFKLGSPNSIVGKYLND